MKNVQRNKKIYAICIALLFILSSSAALIPNLEVKANTTVNIKATPFYSLIPTGDQLFDKQYYDISSANLSDEIKYGCNDGIIVGEGKPYYSYLESFVPFLNDKENNTTQYNGGHSFDSINIVTNDSSLIDYLQHPENYYSLVTFTLNSSNVEMFVYYSDTDFTSKVYACNGGGATFSYNGTIKRFGINFLHSGDSNHDSWSPNVFTQSNSSGIPSMGSGVYILYCTCPLYFVYQTNDYGSTYSSLNTSSNIRSFLANGETSPFLIDRRDYFTNQTPVLTPETDPISDEYYGAWDIDLVPVGDVLNGELMFKFTPTNLLNDVSSGFRVEYFYQIFLNGATLKSSDISLTGNQVRDTKIALSDQLNLSYTLDPILHKDQFQIWAYLLNGYTTCNSQKYTTDVSGQYIKDSSANVLRGITGTGSYYTTTADTTKELNIDMYNQLSTYKKLDYFVDSPKSETAGVTVGGFSAGIASSSGKITSCTLTVYAAAYYNDNQFTDWASATYDYMSGSVTKVGTKSTYNNNYDGNNAPTGMTPQDFEDQLQDTSDEIQDAGGIQNITGGNITGGNSTSNAAGGTATATADNNIEVQSNWKYFIDSTVENEENANGLSAIQQGYEEVINFDYENDSFLKFLFTSGIWSVHPFDYILAFLGTMVTIGIFTGILKLFRG